MPVFKCGFIINPIHVGTDISAVHVSPVAFTGILAFVLQARGSVGVSCSTSRCLTTSWRRDGLIKNRQVDMVKKAIVTETPNFTMSWTPMICPCFTIIRLKLIHTCIFLQTKATKTILFDLELLVGELSFLANMHFLLQVTTYFTI